MVWPWKQLTFEHITCSFNRSITNVQIWNVSEYFEVLPYLPWKMYDTNYKVQKKAIKGNVKLASRDVSRCDWFQYMKRWKKCTLEPTVKSIMDAVLLSRSPYVQHVKSGIWKLPVQHGWMFFGSECHAEVFFNLGQHESPPTPTWATNLCDLLTTSFAYTVRGMGMCVGVDGLPLSISIARQAWSSGTFTVNEESVCVMKWSLDWWNHPPYN